MEYLQSMEAERVRRINRRLESEEDYAPVEHNPDHLCPVCSKPKSPTFWLCPNCAKAFGPYRNWPNWLKFIKNDEQNAKRLDQRERAHGRVWESELPLDIEL